MAVDKGTKERLSKMLSALSSGPIEGTLRNFDAGILQDHIFSRARAYVREDGAFVLLLGKPAGLGGEAEVRDFVVRDVRFDDIEWIVKTKHDLTIDLTDPVMMGDTPARIEAMLAQNAARANVEKSMSDTIGEREEL
jgi:hypothetical protein